MRCSIAGNHDRGPDTASGTNGQFTKKLARRIEVTPSGGYFFSVFSFAGIFTRNTLQGGHNLTITSTHMAMLNSSGELTNTD
jgi:hypothetical protein